MSLKDRALAGNQPVEHRQGEESRILADAPVPVQ
jgi:hypothetical protein